MPFLCCFSCIYRKWHNWSRVGVEVAVISVVHIVFM
jgi:hypothetical protein